MARSYTLKQSSGSHEYRVGNTGFILFQHNNAWQLDLGDDIDLADLTLAEVIDLHGAHANATGGTFVTQDAAIKRLREWFADAEYISPQANNADWLSRATGIKQLFLK